MIPNRCELRAPLSVKIVAAASAGSRTGRGPRKPTDRAHKRLATLTTALLAMNHVHQGPGFVSQVPEEHRKRTVQSYLTLRDLAPEIPWCPVVQGWQPDDYRRTIELYDKNGVNLERLPIVGVGSVCRRHGTAQAVGILRAVLHEIPQARLHGFGFKTQGLMLAKDLLVSADSMAWSVKARREGICLPGHSHPSAPNSKDVFLRKKGHQKCSSCIEFAIRRRNSMLVKVAEAQEIQASKSKQMAFAF